MKYDDGIRSKFGIAICLRDMGNGKSRLFFDDVKSDKEENPIQWGFDNFYTYTPELDNTDIDVMDLTNERFQEIGKVVVARLLAQNGRVK